MRHKLMLVMLITLLNAVSGNAGWFDNDDQIKKVEQQLHQQRQDTGAWMVVAGMLGIGCITLFGIGAAIGSKVRKEVKKRE